MPKRIVDGDALAKSDKLAKVQPLKIRPEFANMLTLALANGTFECDPKRVHSDLYSYNRPDVSVEDIAAILGEFQRVKLLFRFWGKDGKVWGHFLGSMKPGRCVPKSQLKRNYKKGHPVPMKELREFETGSATYEPIEITWKDNPRTIQGSSLLGIGVGVGTGEGRGVGIGTSLDDDEQKPPAFFSSQTGIENTAVEEQERGAGAEPRIPTAKREPETAPVSAKANPKTGFIPPHMRVAPVSAKATPAQSAELLSPRDGLPIPIWMKLTHPPRITDADFCPLDWAFMLTEPVNGMEPAEIRRAVFWHWRHDPKKFWRNQNIPAITRFVGALARMLSDVPKDFRKKVTGGRLEYSNPNCEQCGGKGYRGFIPNPYYAPEDEVKMPHLCDCKREHPYPWRITVDRKDDD